MGSSLLIRNLADEVKTELRVRAARNVSKSRDKGLIENRGFDFVEKTARMFFGPENGVDLKLPPREPMREPPDFGWVLDGPDGADAEEDESDGSKPGP